MTLKPRNTSTHLQHDRCVWLAPNSFCSRIKIQSTGWYLHWFYVTTTNQNTNITSECQWRLFCILHKTFTFSLETDYSSMLNLKTTHCKIKYLENASQASCMAIFSLILLSSGFALRWRREENKTKIIAHQKFDYNHSFSWEHWIFVRNMTQKNQEIKRDSEKLVRKTSWCWLTMSLMT